MVAAPLRGPVQRTVLHPCCLSCCSRLASHQRRPQPRYRTTSTRKRQFRGGLQVRAATGCSWLRLLRGRDTKTRIGGFLQICDELIK